MSAPSFGDCKYDDDSKLVVFEGAQAVDVADVVEAMVAEDLTEEAEAVDLGKGNGSEAEASGEGNGVVVEAAEAVGAQHGAGPKMGPPSSKRGRALSPSILEDRFSKSVSAGESSSATMVTDASQSSMKRPRDGDGKLAPPP